MMLRVAGVVPESMVDGPGVRFSLFVQGCSHRCPGCHNPAAQDRSGGIEVNVPRIAEQIKAAGYIDGVTFSGGEPFEQAAPLAALAEKIRHPGLNLVLYTGYTFNELLLMSRRDRSVRRLLEAGWLLVDGPFLQAERDLTLPYRGSRNQRLLDLPASLSRGEAVSWRGTEFRIQPPMPQAATADG